MASLPMFQSRLQDPFERPLGGFDELPSILPGYYLPKLDENASGSERLLSGLSKSSLGDANHLAPTTSSKGKERERARVQQSDILLGEEVRENLAPIWSRLQEETGQAGPSSGRIFKPIKTWDALDEASERQFGLMTENKGLFEALNLNGDVSSILPLKGGSATTPKDPRDLLRVLMQSSLGTSSSPNMVWNKRNSRFVWTGVRMEGVSKSSLASSITLFTEIATAIRRLENIIDTHSTTPLTPTHHAMIHAISTYLTYLKQQLTIVIGKENESQVSGIHAAQSSLRSLHDLAVLLCDIICWPLVSDTPDGLPARASSLLTHIYGFFTAHSSANDQSTPNALACAYILSRSSGPFLSLLHGWLGLSSSSADEDLNPASQPWEDLGIIRKPQPATENGEPRWSFDFSSKKMPGVIPRESRRTLFEAGRSLRLLREASGNHHPLCATEWSLETGWGWGEDQRSSQASSPLARITTNRSSSATIRSHERHVKKDVDYWRRSVLDRSQLKTSGSLIRTNQPRKHRKGLPASFTQSSSLASQPTHRADSVGQDFTHRILASEMSPIDSLWAQFSLAPGSHLEQKPEPLWAASPLDSLRTFLSHHLSPSHPLLPLDSPSLTLFVSNHLLAPLLAHGKLVSTSLVSLYLDDLQLLDHYDILRSFFLGGDIGFYERVSAALFGKDEAGAGEALGLGKRARTRARLGLGGDDTAKEEGVWGIGLGLGLSERARWPPGGAELAYALRTTLTDDEEKRGGPWQDIEDKIGFGVKTMPEDDRDGQRARWMDPQAIEALDFLYLSYSAPTFISPLMPASLLEKYQSVNNLLLRLCRVKTVTRSLYLDTVHQTPVFEEPVKQGIDSGSRPASRASQRDRPVHILFPTRSKVDFTLHRLRYRMSAFATTLERYLLDIAIGANWDVMRRRLEKLKAQVPGSDNPVPSTPDDHDQRDGFDTGDVDQSEDSDEEASTSTLMQLHSIDSLVIYHQVIMNRILRASLLAPSAGYQVTYKVLMGLFGCILDLGKTVKEIERGTIGWQDGAEKVISMSKDWEERENIFLHAIERLSLRTRNVDGEKEQSHGDERDLELLLGREGEDLEGHVGTSGGELGELLIRLKSGQRDRKGGSKKDRRE